MHGDIRIDGSSAIAVGSPQELRELLKLKKQVMLRHRDSRRLHPRSATTEDRLRKLDRGRLRRRIDLGCLPMGRNASSTERWRRPTRRCIPAMRRGISSRSIRLTCFPCRSATLVDQGAASSNLSIVVRVDRYIFILSLSRRRAYRLWQTRFMQPILRACGAYSEVIEYFLSRIPPFVRDAPCLLATH